VGRRARVRERQDARPEVTVPVEGGAEPAEPEGPEDLGGAEAGEGESPPEEQGAEDATS
jgi:hypothetical protein